MKTNYFNKLAIVIFLQLGLTTSVSAEEHTEHNYKEKAHDKAEAYEKTGERVQHGSHEHGKAKLTMAKTDTGLEITLDTPAANIFGFGHPPSVDDEREVVQVAEKKLNAGDTLFITDSEASCKLKDVTIESSVISGHAKDEDHDKHDDHKKDNGHDKHDKHDDHKKDKDHDKHDDHSTHDNEGTHSDVEATWVFQCGKPKALKSVEVKLFSQFPKGFQHLNVEWITSSHAGTAELEEDGMVELGK